MSAAAPASVGPLAVPPVPERTPVVKPPRRWWMTLLNAVPNLVVFALLGSVLYFGHHTGWKMPKLSEALGTASPAPVDWCPEHLVPESQCVECKPELFPRAKPFGFCKTHGVAECVIDHPELAQVKGSPQLPRYDTVAALALLPRPENNSRNTLHKSVVQFVSAESATKSGIDVDVVQERPMADAITANGELAFDPTRLAHLSSRGTGTVAAVFKIVGDSVQPGQILALVDVAQVGQVKAQLLQSIVQLQLKKATVERLRGLGTSGGIAGKTVIEAEAAVQEADIAYVSARQALANLGFDVPEKLTTRVAAEVADELRYLGLPAALLESLPAGAKTGNLIAIRAPIEGVVIASDVVAGEVVDSTNVLFTVANPQRLWMTLHVRQEDARFIGLGLPVQFRADDGSETVTGEISWISPAIDPRTRTLEVRVIVDNREGKVRDKTFGTGRIVLRDEPHAIVVPREAVQSTNDAHFVFVRDKNYLQDGSPKVFHVRQVRIGASDDQSVELLAGVLPGEVVATKGSPVLLAQLLRSSLGAGCGCHAD